MGGRAFFVSDFDENIVSIYHAMAGVPPPRICLPYLFLSILVHASITLHIVVGFLTFGKVNVLGPMMGLHDGALAAALPCTVTSARARKVLGYQTYVTREAAVASCKGVAAPLLDKVKVEEAVATACARSRFT